MSEETAARGNLAATTATAGFSGRERRKHGLADFALTKPAARTIIITKMDKQFAESSEDVAARGLRYTREQFDELLSETENYVRQNPGQSLVYAFVAGFILNRLPVGRILSGSVRLLLFALKPAVLIYGATKLYQAFEQEE